MTSEFWPWSFGKCYFTELCKSSKCWYWKFHYPVSDGILLHHIKILFINVTTYPFFQEFKCRETIKPNAVETSFLHVSTGNIGFDHWQQMLSVVSLKGKAYFPLWKSVCQTTQVWMTIVCLFFQVKIMFYKLYNISLVQLATQSHRCFLGSAIVLRLVAEVLYLSSSFSFSHRIFKKCVLIGWDLIKLILLFHQDSLKMIFFFVSLWVPGSTKKKRKKKTTSTVWCHCLEATPAASGFTYSFFCIVSVNDKHGEKALELWCK